MAENLGKTNFKVKVITPSGLVTEGLTSALSLETSKGQVSILPAHSAYTSLLGAGILRFTDTEGNFHEFITSGGFCNFSTGETGDGEITVLTDTVDFKEDLNLSETESNLEELEKGLMDINQNESSSRVHLEKLHRARAQKDLLAS